MSTAIKRVAGVVALALVLLPRIGFGQMSVEDAQQRLEFKQKARAMIRASTRPSTLPADVRAVMEDDRWSRATSSRPPSSPSGWSGTMNISRQPIQRIAPQPQRWQDDPIVVAPVRRVPATPQRRMVGPLIRESHWVDSVGGDGRIVVLEDGSVWEVDFIDRIDSMLWLPTDDIIVAPSNLGDFLLINTGDHSTVHARLLRL